MVLCIVNEAWRGALLVFFVVGGVGYVLNGIPLLGLSRLAGKKVFTATWLSCAGLDKSSGVVL